MKKLLIFILIIFCGKAFSQQLTQSIMTDLHLRVKDKDLQNQMIKHEKIISDIFIILNAERNASVYLEEKSRKEADQFRKDQHLKKDQAILSAAPRLNHQDSLNLKLLNQDALLLQKYKEFRDAFTFDNTKKLSKEDQYWRDFFYKEHMNSIDHSYSAFFENKRKTKTPYEKLALYSTNSIMPILKGCEENKEMSTEKCFSTKFRTEIERQYEVPDFIDYDLPNTKTKILFRINKNGLYEVLEIAETSRKYFLDMLSLDIAQHLFKDKKIANPQEEDFYSKIPLTYNFD